MAPRFAGCILGALGFFCATAFAALERVNDGLPERPALIQSVRAKFLTRDYSAVEKMVTAARGGARFTDGCWQLAVFYNGFSLSSQAPDGAWESWLQRFDQWDAAVPGSVTARLARAEAWASHNGGPTVSPTRHSEGVAEVRRILETTSGANQCPDYYYMMMWVAREQAWPKAEFESLFTAAVALAPDYEAIYFRKAAWISGHSDEYGGGYAAANFAAETPALTSPALGGAMYTRVMWSMLDKMPGGAAMENVRILSMDSAALAALQQKADADPHPGTGLLIHLMRDRAKDGALKLHGVDWAKMKNGFEDLAKLYPTSMWNKNAYCFYAFCANDRETTSRLVAELHDRFAPGIWPSEDFFNQVKEWARTGRVAVEPARQGFE